MSLSYLSNNRHKVGYTSINRISAIHSVLVHTAVPSATTTEAHGFESMQSIHIGPLHTIQNIVNLNLVHHDVGSLLLLLDMGVVHLHVVSIPITLRTFLLLQVFVVFFITFSL